MNIEVAITLVKQAIDQDKKKNYEEAARCYREAIITFKTVSQFRGISKGVQQAIILKCDQYEERLKKLDKYLLANADLSQLFKHVVDYHKRPDSQTRFVFWIKFFCLAKILIYYLFVSHFQF